jgi:hypothetical protein
MLHVQEEALFRLLENQQLCSHGFYVRKSLMWYARESALSLETSRPSSLVLTQSLLEQGYSHFTGGFAGVQAE